jgi:hypothetical protein
MQPLQSTGAAAAPFLPIIGAREKISYLWREKICSQGNMAKATQTALKGRGPEGRGKEEGWLGLQFIFCRVNWN